MKYDYLIVGAGFAGSVMAERLASQLDKMIYYFLFIWYNFLGLS